MGGEAIASPAMTGVTVVDHPLVARHLSVLRDKATPSGDFRRRLSDISMLLLFEALRDLRVREDAIETPLETTGGMRLADEIVVIAILRAGLGMTDGALRLIPEARVGHLGLYRDEESLQPVGYYESIPRHAADAEVVVVDPMLATGGSAVSALDRLKRDGVGRLRFVCLVAAPEGIAAVQASTPRCRSSAPRSTASSTGAATSARGWATRATASSARSRRAMKPEELAEVPLVSSPGRTRTRRGRNPGRAPRGAPPRGPAGSRGPHVGVSDYDLVTPRSRSRPWRALRRYRR